MSKKHRRRPDLQETSTAPWSNPFADLKERFADLPVQAVDVPVSQEEAAQEEATRGELSPFSVGRTRKGGWPLSIERRAGGKVVTVIERITGDAGLLLKQLRKHCGTGGTLREGALELQGDQRRDVEIFLNNLVR